MTFRRAVSLLFCVSIFFCLVGCPNPTDTINPPDSPSGKSSDASLTALRVSIGSLSPGFNATTTGYDVDLPNSISSIRVTATTASSTAKLEINGSAVDSGIASAPISLNAGQINHITIDVVAEDAATTRSYTIDATRASTAGSLLFTSSIFGISEDSGSLTVYAHRAGGSVGAVTVEYATGNGTAVAGSDYTTTSGTLSWADGDAADKSFAVPILDDANVEGSEVFTVALSAPTGGAVIGSTGSATVTIIDDEFAGNIHFLIPTYTAGEGGFVLRVPVMRTDGFAGPITVDYTIANGTAMLGSDFDDVTGGTLAWADGQTGIQYIWILLNDDTETEGDETFAITLGNSTGGAAITSPDTMTVTIADNDSPGVILFFFSFTSSVIDENASYANICLVRSYGSVGAVSVSYTTSNGSASAGSDYTATSGTLSWADGDDGLKDFYIPILDDATYEGQETFTVTLSAPTGGVTLGSPSACTITINDDELPTSGGGYGYGIQ